MNNNVNDLQRLRYVRSALYVPASNARALEKAPNLDADMLIIDLEDAVPHDAKSAARKTALAFADSCLGEKLIAIRINGQDSKYYLDDVAALRQSNVDIVVAPKVDSAIAAAEISEAVGVPVLAMIETPAGLYAASEIAAEPGVAGLIAGTNDIAAGTGIRLDGDRSGLQLALQMIVLAASAADKPRYDGVCNRLDDMVGFDAECMQGLRFGFTGKTLIHPNQITIANLAFGSDADDVAEAEELIAVSRGGAERFRGRMIETMHVEQAKMTIERSRRATGSS